MSNFTPAFIRHYIDWYGRQSLIKKDDIYDLAFGIIMLVASIIAITIAMMIE